MTQTLLALPEDVAEALDQRAPNPADRDHLVAEAIRAYLAWPRAGEDASDLAIINANATELNAEAEDALSYQVPLWGAASFTWFNIPQSMTLANSGSSSS